MKVVVEYRSIRQARASEMTFKNMIKGIVVFEILLTRIEAKWKMSQNRDFDDAVGAALGLEANEDENSLEVASEIRALASRPSTGI